MTAQEIIALLNLKPLEMEGGYFRQNYRNKAFWNEHKPMSTAIYFLLTPETCSCLHRLPNDEVYHFYLGDPVELLVLDDAGQGSVRILGSDLAAGMQVQTAVPARTWQGSRLCPGGSWALLGTTMAPGFTDDDFTAMPDETLQRLCTVRPELQELLQALQKK